MALLAPLGLVLFLSFAHQPHERRRGADDFLGLRGLVGIALAPILWVYTGASVAQVFFITAATFGAMSLWGYTTKTDLSGFGSFLFMGLIGLVIASVVSFFWHPR